MATSIANTTDIHPAVHSHNTLYELRQCGKAKPVRPEIAYLYPEGLIC